MVTAIAANNMGNNEQFSLSSLVRHFSRSQNMACIKNLIDPWNAYICYFSKVWTVLWTISNAESLFLGTFTYNENGVKYHDPWSKSQDDDSDSLVPLQLMEVLLLTLLCQDFNSWDHLIVPNIYHLVSVLQQN